MSRLYKTPRLRKDGNISLRYGKGQGRARPWRERLTEYTDKVTPYGPKGKCWRWTACLDNYGYGPLYVEGQLRKSHQAAYFDKHGVWPDWSKKEVIRHSCHTRDCVNPAHLSLGTPGQNSSDMVAAGHSLRGSKHNLTKLNERTVHIIRTAYRLGSSRQDIANQLGLHRDTIFAIITGKNWGHVPGALGPLKAWTQWQRDNCFQGSYRDVSQAEAEDIRPLRDGGRIKSCARA